MTSAIFSGCGNAKKEEGAKKETVEKENLMDVGLDVDLSLIHI